MTSTSTPTVRRFLQVSVEIPPSPLHAQPSFSSLSTSSKLKENALSASIPKRKAEDQTNIVPVKKARRLSDEDSSYVNCHQCGKKRDPSDAKSLKKPSATFKRCNVLFCRNCLLNRYNEDLDSIKLAPRSQQDTGHCGGENYTFKCFKCRDICNCSRCRKLKGLAPIGNQFLEERKKNIESQKVIAPASNPEVPVKRVPKPKPKVVSKVPWTPLSTSLSYADAEDRIFIREFVARFAPETGISKSHIEELGFIAGTGRCQRDEELVDWVSEAALKAILIWLLELLRDDSDDPLVQSAFKTTLSEVRSSSCNLNKMWTGLATLRDSERTLALTIPDPLPCPESAVIRSTRSTRDLSPGAIHIAQSAQLVPVVLSLVEAVLQADAVRQELDAGLQRYRECIREKQEGAKKENERWEGVKGVENAIQLPDFKAKRNNHKHILNSLDRVLKVVSYDSTVRSGPLGVDHEGRKYWAVSPGANDRQYAKAFLEWHATGGRKPKRGRGARNGKKGDPDYLPDWSSVVVVWGRKPPDAVTDRDAQEGWWVFSDPAEVLQLAAWLEDKIDQGDSRQKSLVSGLTEHAAILKWKEASDGENVQA
ncbi:hypothetical protein BDZ89DRAFT_1126044 [Hymenopellis radicata]|nr:hypothetical protein BDZ89DRAFT_1126044 [Hymenopellis radicata]